MLWIVLSIALKGVMTMASLSLAKFEAYLLTERRVSQNTFTAYKKDIEQFVEFLTTKKTALEKATTDHIKKFIHFMHAQGMSARSIARKISSIKVLFNYAEEKYEWPNITEDMVFPKIEKRLPRYLSEEEVQVLFAIANKDQSVICLRNKVIILLLYTSGMRNTEMIHLKTSDIHFDTKLISVQGKGGKMRMIPIHHEVVPVLKEYLKTTHATFMRTKKCSTDFLFPVLYGGKAKPITRQAFWGTLREWCSLAGFTESISPHKLRHSLATHMLKNGMDLRSLQLLLGHESIATVQIYTHVEKDFLRKVYDKKHPRS